MGAQASVEIVLDAGALIAFEKANPKMRAIAQESLRRGLRLLVPTTVLAQVWRSPARHTRISTLVNSRNSEVVAFDQSLAEATGLLCAFRGTNDIVDASVVVLAQIRHARIVTTDPKDLLHLNPKADLAIVT